MPEANRFVSFRSSGLRAAPSSNSRMPRPRITGCTMNRYRSIRFSFTSALKSWPLPARSRSLPGCFFSLQISSMTLLLISFEPGHSALSSVVETTYLGIVFIFSPNSPVPSMVGHAEANPSYVLRPSSCASLACNSSHLNRPASSLNHGPDHLPGSSNTPSRDRYSVATSLISASSAEFLSASYDGAGA